jgi:hypothetical protein
MMIEQYGSSVRAKVDRTTKNGLRVLEYEVRITAGQLALFFEDVTARGYIVGTMVLPLSVDLARLEGRSTYFDHSEHVVKSSARKYIRQVYPLCAELAANTLPVNRADSLRSWAAKCLPTRWAD